MSDVFISYAREDIEKAKELSAALESAGLMVWWDRQIPTGKTFDEVIEEALDHTKCVIALWSDHSVNSRWVRLEAQEGVEREILIPVMIEDVKIPLAFRNIQTANLIGWNGEADSIAFRDLLEDVEEIINLERRPQTKMEDRGMIKTGDLQKDQIKKTVYNKGSKKPSLISLLNSISKLDLARELRWLFLAVFLAIFLAYFFGNLEGFDPERLILSTGEEIFRIELSIIGWILGFIGTYLLRFISWVVSEYAIEEYAN